jgi:2-oxo-hept-3-ene-1,7-dioate hydratase
MASSDTGVGGALDAVTHQRIADELLRAEQERAMLPLLTTRYEGMTVDDSYAVQRIWHQRGIDAGRVHAGRKIGLTSKVMQAATGITEPDYGAIFADQIYDSGSRIEFDQFSNVRVEMELAFMLKHDLEGTEVTLDDVLAATDYVVPALEILSSRIELAGRTIVDTISDNAALGAVVVGSTPIHQHGLDLPWVSAVLYRNETIEESGVAAAVLGHPALGIAWLSGKLAQHGDSLKAGELVLAGSFTRPLWVERGDNIRGDYHQLGEVSCRFV